jgi:hypothetical protein
MDLRIPLELRRYGIARNVTNRKLFFGTTTNWRQEKGDRVDSDRRVCISQQPYFQPDTVTDSANQSGQISRHYSFLL